MSDHLIHVESGEWNWALCVQGEGWPTEEDYTAARELGLPVKL